MVSADNLNFDVLELIFAYVSGSDLPSVALVSRSFLVGAIPKLYRTISFRPAHAKRYPTVISPFAAVVAHPQLAVHIRAIDIRAVPILKSKSYPIFIRECTRALALCQNLVAFRCTVNALPPFLPSLPEKEGLEEVRVRASITTEQAERLLKLDKIRNLTLDYGSWNMMDLLPRWSQSLHQTLSSLTLYMSTELNESVLDSVLSQLPRLLGLHVVGCPKVDHPVILRLVSHTPFLESLSMTTTENTCPLYELPHPLHHLRSLAFDTRCTHVPSSPELLSSILSHIQLSSPPLTSFSIKFPERKTTMGPVVRQLLSSCAHTLRNLAFLDCAVELDSIIAICEACINLDRLDVVLPRKDIVAFTKAIGRSYNLRVLVDTDSHVTHGPRASLTQDNIRYMMGHVRNLRKIVSDKRVWTGQLGVGESLIVSFERQSTSGAGAHWFIPHE